MLADALDVGQSLHHGPTHLRSRSAPLGILLISYLPLCHRSLLLGVETISCVVEEVTKASLLILKTARSLASVTVLRIPSSPLPGRPHLKFFSQAHPTPV